MYIYHSLINNFYTNYSFFFIDDQSDSDDNDEYNDETNSKYEKKSLTKIAKDSKIAAESLRQQDNTSDEFDYSKYNDIQGEGLIKTRSQRRAESQSKIFNDVAQPVSDFDIDSIWESMNSSSSSSSSISTPTTVDSSPSKTPSPVNEDFVVIKRVFNFAGKITHEQHTVPRSSAEAEAYLKEEALKKSKNKQQSPTVAIINDRNDPKNAKTYTTTMKKKRQNGPVKRKRSSLLEELNNFKAKKINTLEKSRIDWLGYVDKEGIKDELVLHNKDGFLEKQDFLSRVDRRVESELKFNSRKI